MKIIIDQNDFSRLRPTTRQDIIATLLSSVGTTSAAQNHTEGFDWEEVMDLTPDQVAEFMQGCNPKTVAGLQIIAEQGPVVAANALQEAGIDNYGHFQGSVTKRTRTITGNKHAFLFTWDDWTVGENAERGYGHYAVTDTTFRSLRNYFELD